MRLGTCACARYTMRILSPHLKQQHQQNYTAHHLIYVMRVCNWCAYIPCVFLRGFVDCSPLPPPISIVASLAKVMRMQRFLFQINYTELGNAFELVIA